MSPIRANRGVVGDPEPPWVDRALAGHSGAGTVAYLMGGDGCTGQHPQGCLARGARVRAVQGAVDVQGGGQAGGAFGQFFVISGRESTFASQLGALDDLAGAEQDPLAVPSGPHTRFMQCHMP